MMDAHGLRPYDRADIQEAARIAEAYGEADRRIASAANSGSNYSQGSSGHYGNSGSSKPSSK
jgi:hypothetical protein